MSDYKSDAVQKCDGGPRVTRIGGGWGDGAECK